MTILIILEIIKTLAWVFILILAILKRKELSVNMFWVTAISAALMILAGLQDIYNYQCLEQKSVLWFVASLFIITNYVLMIRSCCKINKAIHNKMDDFKNRIERDKKTLL